MWVHMWGEGASSEHDGWNPAVLPFATPPYTTELRAGHTGIPCPLPLCPPPPDDPEGKRENNPCHGRGPHNVHSTASARDSALLWLPRPKVLEWLLSLRWGGLVACPNALRAALTARAKS